MRWGDKFVRQKKILPTRRKKASKRRSPGGLSASHYFWVRPANAELDRTGDFLLENLALIRRGD
jgi:hypothetical protein